jgi:hypothetical protein
MAEVLAPPRVRARKLHDSMGGGRATRSGPAFLTELALPMSRLAARAEAPGTSAPALPDRRHLANGRGASWSAAAPERRTRDGQSLYK